MRPKLLSLAVAFGMTAACSHQLQTTSNEAADAPLDASLATADSPSAPLIAAELGEAQLEPMSQPLAVQVAEVSAEPEINTLWDRMRIGMQMVGQHEYTRFKKQVEWYASHQSYFDRVFKRAERYLHFITSEIETRNMPLELALLPVVESAYDPFAYSHSHAVGLWQFMPATASRFGLDRNWWYEGRRDVVASTTAALDYLTYLHKKFDGDWLLALAAYNSGEGTVSRAIRSNKKAGKPTDFWSLKLPKETRAYVPQLLAVAEIVKNADKYKITLADIPNEPYFDRVNFDAQIDLAQAAKMAGIEINELYLLNPAYNRWTTAPGDEHHLLLPCSCIEHFKQTLSTTPKEQWIATREYIVKSGDSLSRIANTNKVSVADLRRENNLKRDLIRVGQILKIPGAGGAAPIGASQVSYYNVTSGDSLWEIARTHKVRVKDLRAWNNLSANDLIRPGQQLQVSSTKPMTTSRKLSYKVKRGDSLARIANRFNIRIKDIVSWNKINPVKYLQPGQKLTLFVDIRRI